MEQIVVIAIGVPFLAAFAWLLRRVARDAEARGKSGRRVAVLVFLFQLPGLLLWLAFRPEKQIGYRDDI